MDRPNIVVILADDTGYGDVGCYNDDSKIPTPNIDRVAAEGIGLTEMMVTLAELVPARRRDKDDPGRQESAKTEDRQGGNERGQIGAAEPSDAMFGLLSRW